MVDARHAFVCGWPIEHSRSPLIHNFWLQKYGIKGDYTKQAYDEDQVVPFIQGLNKSQFVGGNVTVPHKETAYSLLDHLEPTALRLGAVNTIWCDDGKLVGDNTDGYGFLANLDQSTPNWDSKENQLRGALVLGAGGAARAIIDSLLSRGFNPVIIANRTISRAEELARKFGSNCQAVSLSQLPSSCQNCSMIVNTTTVGMGDDQSPINLANFSKDSVATDIIYSPLQTPFLRQADMLGMQTVDGLGMLLHQAVPGFEKWFGVRPEVTEELRQILLKDLGEEL